MLLLPSAAALADRASEPHEAMYFFSTGQYSIEMKVTFEEPYRGRRLVVYSNLEPNREICLSANGQPDGCLERFVGALSTVQFSIKLRNGKRPSSETIREYVTTIAQTSKLPRQDPFWRQERVVDGLASDVQAFGYDESPIPKDQRQKVREEWSKLWLVFRQELYIGQDSQPFAVIEWKHTLDKIGIVRVIPRQPT